MNNAAPRSAEAGFSLVELVVATAVLLAISGLVTSALLQMTNAQRTITNRTDMHSAVRSATELLQQEVGQAGRVALTPATSLGSATISGDPTAALTDASGVFVGELLVVAAKGTSPVSQEETVKVTAISGNTITVNYMTANGVSLNGFHFAHEAGAAVTAAGGFGTGVVPPTLTNGSNATRLKLYGDINGDGKMVYVEYFCDAVTHRLYRTMIDWKTAVKPAVSPGDVLLDNVWPNPPQTAGGPNLPCFQYQMDLLSNSYVLDVAVTLTAQTQQIDPVTRQYQQETKALLNVSPRNTISAWQSAGGNINRVQAMPPSIANLLP
jgi:type II secretory pathway pseudopilin PulG